MELAPVERTNPKELANAGDAQSRPTALLMDEVMRLRTEYAPKANDNPSSMHQPSQLRDMLNGFRIVDPAQASDQHRNLPDFDSRPHPNAFIGTSPIQEHRYRPTTKGKIEEEQ